MSNAVEVRIPDIGDFSEVPVVEIPVSVGDTIAEGDAVVVLESDKATLDVPATHGGRIAEVKVAVGDRVSKGAVILVLDAQQTTINTSPDIPANSKTGAQEFDNPAPPDPAVTSARPEAAVPPVAADLSEENRTPVYASPSVRRYARELGVAIGEVEGSGANGRIIRKDIEGYIKQRLSAGPAATAAGTAPPAGLPAWPTVDFAQFGPVERVPLSRIARISGPALARNAIVIPHVTNFDKADVTDLEEFRKTVNAEAADGDAKITMLAFAVKAAVGALKAYPKFNASLDGDELVLKNYFHIGFAADTPEGLVVPVVRDADKKGIREIALEMAGLSAKARSGKLAPQDMQGGTFTISSLGGIGGTNFTPIINAPEVAILGMTRAEVQPVWDGAAFQPRLIQPVSLSWDHRVVDGVAAARFLVHLCRSLNDFRRITL